MFLKSKVNSKLTTSESIDCSIISVSKKGYDLSLLLKKHLDKDSTIINTDIYYKDVKNTFDFLTS